MKLRETSNLKPIVVEANSIDEFIEKLNRLDQLADLQYSVYTHNGNIIWSALALTKGKEKNVRSKVSAQESEGNIAYYEKD